MLEDVWPYWTFFLALIGHFLAPYEAILAPYEGMLAPCEAMLAPCEPILGSCWAYVGPILTHFLPILAQIKNFDPFWKTCKNRILEQKCPPPKLKLISYNAIANGSRRHTRNASAPSVRADFPHRLVADRDRAAAAEAPRRVAWLGRAARTTSPRGGGAEWVGVWEDPEICDTISTRCVDGM